MASTDPPPNDAGTPAERMGSRLNIEFASQKGPELISTAISQSGRRS